jgi:hypothetical protein
MKTMMGMLVLSAAAVTGFASIRSGADDSAALVKALAKSKHSLAEGIKQVSKGTETAISAKFEFDDAGKLSLSVYTAEKGLLVDAEHNALKEYGGSPEQAAWAPGVEVFKDVPHVARASAQLTLMAISEQSLLDVVAKAEKENKGQTLSITPMLDGRKPVFAVQIVSGDKVVDAKYPLLGDEDDEKDEHHEKKR